MSVRTLINRRGNVRRGSLPPPSLSPDEWIASLVAADPTAPADGAGSIRPSRPGNGSRAPGRRASRGRGRWILGVAVVLVLGAAIGFAGAAVQARSRTLDELARTKAAHARALGDLRSQVVEANSALAAASAKATGPVKTKGEVRTVWVPNGRGIRVELTGYRDTIGIHDVRLTRAYGFSDVVGIAVNVSGHELTYVQLGCSLLDAKGGVLANVIDNRETWPAGASWGFDCSAEVNATGAIVRVDAVG